LVDTFAGGSLVLDGIIHPVVSASAWFIKYIYLSNLQFQNNAIKVLLPQAYLTFADFDSPVQALYLFLLSDTFI